MAKLVATWGIIKRWQDSPFLLIHDSFSAHNFNKYKKHHRTTTLFEHNRQATIMPAFLQNIINATILSPYGTNVDGKHNLLDETVLNGRGTSTNVDGSIIDVVHYTH
jgi:hypothetical protein